MAGMRTGWQLAVVGSMLTLSLGANQAARCAMRPLYTTFPIPRSGLQWLPGEEFEGACDPVPARRWSRRPSGDQQLWVATEGPGGSGRYWTITVGVGSARERVPARGFCLGTETLGWRTLRNFENSALPWLMDGDSNGQAELVVWRGFPLTEDASAAEFALMAWVYELTPEGALRLAPPQTRRMAERIARAYRAPLDTDSFTVNRRAIAARLLGELAAQRCTALQL
jgi:hypothetical protein